MEMTVRQCLQGVCTIIMRKKQWHPDPGEQGVRRVSPFLRRQLHEGASNFAMTQSRLTACKVNQLWPSSNPSYFTRLVYEQHVLSSDPHASYLKAVAKWRLPNYEDYRTAARTAQARSQIDESPLAAIEILSSKHPEAFLE